jgi:hypothetical protein
MSTSLALSPFLDFAQAFEVAHYWPVPDDWFVAVSDVVSSTKAISNGRYKDVNLAGAATIACVLNACSRDDLPFCFGGDGGVVLVPPELQATARDALCAVQHMTKQVLSLTLRCALIPLSEIRRRGRELLMASHDLGSGRLLAMMAGGGVNLAETLCKSPDGAAFRVPEGSGDPDLTGLSCRWQPLKAAHGVIVSLVIHAKDGAPLPAIYRDLYRGIIELTGAGNSPARLDAYHQRFPPRGLLREAQLTAPERRFRQVLKIIWEAAWSKISIANGKTYGGFNGRAYRRSLPRHSDYRKYADSLRMVIDCTPVQADAIESLLDGEWRAGRIDYGTHRAAAALMTCFVRDFHEGGHIHFIDGADGGYALAALSMKERIRASPLTKS